MMMKILHQKYYSPQSTGENGSKKLRVQHQKIAWHSIQCELKIPPSRGFCDIFPQTVGNF